MKAFFAVILVVLSGIYIGSAQVQYVNDLPADASVETLKTKQFNVTSDTNLGINNGVYWFKIDPLEQSRSILSLETSHTQDVRLIDANGLQIGQLKDTRYPSFFIINRIIEYPLFLTSTFPLEANFPLKVYDESMFSRNEKRSLLGIGFSYGTAVALLIATLIFFFIARSRQFLFFGILSIAIGLSIIAKDNILYFFGIEHAINSRLELLGHFLVGVPSALFVFFFLDLDKTYSFPKTLQLIFTITAAIGLILYFVTGAHWAFYMTDIATVATTINFWVISVPMIRKPVKRNILIIIYVTNMLVVLDAFVLQNFGLGFMNLSINTVKWIMLLDLTAIGITLVHSFRGLQNNTLVMKKQIKNYLERISELNRHKEVRTSDDSYMESLIYDFNLGNLEVKILNGISEGKTNQQLMTQHSISNEKLKSITNSIFQKLGIEEKTDLSILVN